MRSEPVTRTDGSLRVIACEWFRDAQVRRLGRQGAGTEYRALEAGELHIDYGLFLRIVDLCGWPR